MNAKIRVYCLLGALPLLAFLAGCGNYTITFEVADVINAWGPDGSRKMLDIDIVCLSKKDAKHHPEIVNGSMMADEWFRARNEISPKIGDIPKSQIFALRHGGGADKRDTLLGKPLLSAKDRRGGERTYTYKFKHPDAMNADAAIVIFGAFGSKTGIAKTPPLVIMPPGRKTEIFIDVGKQGMSLAGRR